MEIDVDSGAMSRGAVRGDPDPPVDVVVVGVGLGVGAVVGVEPGVEVGIELGVALGLLESDPEARVSGIG